MASLSGPPQEAERIVVKLGVPQVWACHGRRATLASSLAELSSYVKQIEPVSKGQSED